MAPSLLSLPREIRLEIIRYANYPYNASAVTRGVDEQESDGSPLFSVLGHEKCYGDNAENGECLQQCYDLRAGTINLTRLLCRRWHEPFTLGLLRTCRELYEETFPILYAESDFFIPPVYSEIDESPVIDPRKTITNFCTATSDRVLGTIRHVTIILDHHWFLDDARKTVLSDLEKNLASLQKLTVLVDAGVLENVLKTHKIWTLVDLARKFDVAIEIMCNEYDDFKCFGGKYEVVTYDEFIEGVRREVHTLLDAKITWARRW